MSNQIHNCENLSWLDSSDNANFFLFVVLTENKEEEEERLAMARERQMIRVNSEVNRSQEPSSSSPNTGRHIALPTCNALIKRGYFRPYLPLFVCSTAAHQGAVLEVNCSTRLSSARLDSSPACHLASILSILLINTIEKTKNK